jgi:hypothetical protein
MHGEIENWNNGWYGISLGLSDSEIDRLIALLAKLRNDPEQHFHISSDYSGNGGLGDIEIYLAEPDGPSNLQFSGLALAPGSELPPGKTGGKTGAPTED